MKNKKVEEKYYPSREESIEFSKQYPNTDSITIDDIIVSTPTSLLERLDENKASEIDDFTSFFSESASHLEALEALKAKEESELTDKELELKELIGENNFENNSVSESLGTIALDELSEEELTSKPNTLADIQDSPWELTDLETGEITYQDLSQEVNSLESTLFTFSHYYKTNDSSKEKSHSTYLDEFIDKLPHGIFDKRITGIGATTLEIKSKRHSIIVLPSKRLAYNKHISNEETLYIGSDISVEGVKEIKDAKYTIGNYTRNADITYKKYIVVADSLDTLIKSLKQTNVFENVYRDVFLMVDEIDQMQEDSSFREVLEGVIDYYFKFHYKNRALVSATIQPFSNPKLQEECKFEVDSLLNKLDSTKVASQLKRDSTLITTDNISNAIIEYINNHNSSNDNIVIAFNAVKDALHIIECLDDDLKADCAILCSDYRQFDVLHYYANLIDDCKLPKRINFITSAYFSGVDIKDSYHLCTINNAKNSIQLISAIDFVQIFGRCRAPYKVLSETIIFQPYVPENELPNKDYVQRELLKKADKLVQLFQAMTDIAGNDKVIKEYFEQLKDVLVTKSIGYIYSSKLPLIRKDIDNKYVPAYFNIDYLLRRYDSYKSYSSKGSFTKCLNNIGINITTSTDLIFKSKNEESTDTKVENKQYILDEKYISETIDEIQKAIEENINLKSFLYYKLNTSKNKKQRTFLERYAECYLRVDSDALIDVLSLIKDKNNTTYKNIYNSIIFSSLDVYIIIEKGSTFYLKSIPFGKDFQRT